jgi:uncharacterized membrane protein
MNTALWITQVILSIMMLVIGSMKTFLPVKRLSNFSWTTRSSVNEKGEVRLKTAADQGPIGTATGLFAGSLIGLLGGPIGLAIGATTGALTGAIFDVDADDVNTTFVDEVANELTRGKTAIIAEIDETWTVPVDARLDSMGAVVFRRLKYEVADDQWARESEAIAAEYRNLKEEFKQANEEDKAAIKAAMVKLQQKAQAVNSQLTRKIDESKSQAEAKIRTMQGQMRYARDRRKAKIEKRISEVKEEFSARTEKLNRASKLIGEALAVGGGVRHSVLTEVH